MNNEVKQKRGQIISIASPLAFFKSNQFTRLRFNIDQFLLTMTSLTKNFIILLPLHRHIQYISEDQKVTDI